MMWRRSPALDYVIADLDALLIEELDLPEILQSLEGANPVNEFPELTACPLVVHVMTVARASVAGRRLFGLGEPGHVPFAVRRDRVFGLMACLRQYVVAARNQPVAGELW